ncbi:RagB/SusD family nutrient uptake outer membrane protein [Polaribacter litorisediminis]|uniref:RagB/SusD family nutrient uptake outer membrane protein n=1 Tax=Polaribacter litorisediminis TaxID=1908341 RepID=UPI001CBF55F2|nr:RagB/SusD family nutrient uptake outer membrane protein [Polaribacter litorisediminis]UAM97706.1 RagB/SusD family nutrient uptake outer membrane protein [Polaribacter litorisediminis]
MKLYKTSYFCCLFLIVSCSDFLKLEPGQQISINEQLSTKTGLQLSLNGLYYDIEDLVSSVQVIYPDLQGGNITFSPVINNKEVSVSSVIENSYSFSDFAEDSDYSGFYTSLYDIINQVNVILDYFDTYTFLSEDERNQLQAELMAMRAFAHYQITLMYAQNYNFTADGSHLGIVYNTSPLLIGVDFPARKTMQETYELLKNDLDTALSLFTNTQFLAGASISLFNTTTTEALYARVALQMNDWENAFNHANTIITTSGINLTSKDIYVLEWEKEEDPISEIIFEFSARRTSEGAISQSISQWFKYETDQNYARYVASGDLLDLYTPDDIRTNMFLEQQLPTNVNGIAVNLPYYFTKKYQDGAGTTFIRLSEMYLIRAEANARLNKPTEALQDLNSIRERANLSALNTTTNLLDEIFLERRRELAFEGHLLYDIMRFKKDVIRNKGCLANVCNLNYPSNFFVLPIPQSSTELNENIQQNEGY